MNTLIKKVLEYQETHNDLIFEEIAYKLKGLINIKSMKIAKHNREDLKQELLFEIWKGIFKYKPEKSIISNDLNNQELQKIFKQITENRYFNSFIKKFDIKEYNLKDRKKLIDIINEFNLFCNENQFKKFINIICERRIVDYCRKYKLSQEMQKISLNTTADDGEEYIYKIIDETNIINEVIEIKYELLSKKEIDFIKLFFENDRKLTEKEVGKKLGISQQAVSSQLKRIKKRYNDKKQVLQ